LSSRGLDFRKFPRVTRLELDPADSTQPIAIHLGAAISSSF
jgi:hypothetical protein